MTATPSNVQPPNQGLVLTDYPQLQAYVEYGAGGAQENNIAITWQLATNTAFTANVQNLTTVVRYSSGQVAVQGITTKLTATVWYIRAKATDAGGVESAWTTTNVFQVDHRPFASDMQPSHGSHISYGTGSVTFSWHFSDGDPSDVQTAYQVRAYHASNDALLFDTGKVTSTVQFRTQTIAPANSEGFYYWQVRVYDFYDIASPWSDPTLFQLGVNPTALVLSPTNNGTVSVPNPTIQWAFSTTNIPESTYADLAAAYATYTLLAADNASYNEVLEASINQAGQTHYRVTVLTPESIPGPPFVPINPNPHYIYDSGWLAGTASSHEIPALVHLGTIYEVTVSVRDTGGYEGSSNPIRFTALWAAPTAPIDVVLDTSAIDDPAVGAVQVTWNAVSKDPTFSHWRVYRRIQGMTTWRPVGLPIMEKVDTANGTRAEILDYLFESGRVYEYGVSQVAYRYFNEESESTLTVVSGTLESTKYWLIHGTDPTFNLALSHVVSDTFTDEYEEFDDNIIGRGRRKEVGTRWGYTGSLTCHLRDLDARGSSLELEEILAFKAGRVDAYLRVPFGHIWRVAIGNIGFNRMAGVGRREFGEVTIPYVEVFEATAQTEPFALGA